MQKVSASGPHTAAAPGERLHSVAAPLIAFCRGTPLIAFCRGTGTPLIAFCRGTGTPLIAVYTLTFYTLTFVVMGRHIYYHYSGRLLPYSTVWRLHPVSTVAPYPTLAPTLAPVAHVVTSSHMA